MREGDDACGGADDEDDDHGDVQVADGLHDVLVLAEQQQDEGSRDARQDHGADGDGTREHDEPPVVGSLGGRGDGDPPSDGCADEQRSDRREVPAADLLGDEQGRGDDQSEEERPDGDRVVREQVGHQSGEREDRDGDADEHGQQEASVDVAPERDEASLCEEFQGLEVDAADRVDEFLVDARDEGDRAARDSGYNVSHAHGAALERQHDVA